MAGGVERTRGVEMRRKRRGGKRRKRGGGERIADPHPQVGQVPQVRLLKSGLEQMSRFLAQRVGEHAVAESWRDQRVDAYLGQVLFAQHPPASIGMRNARELVTLSMALDLLLAICSCKE